MAKRAEDFLDAEGFLDSRPARSAAGTSAESFLDAEEFLGSQQGQTIQAPRPTSDQGRLSSAGSSFVRGLGQTISGLPKGLALVGAPSAEVFKNLDRIDQGKPYFTTPMFGTGLGGGGSYYDEDPYQPLYAAYQRGTPEERRKIREGLIESAEAATKSALFKAGQDIDRWFAENFPTNPEYQNEFWASKVPQALGSATGFLGAALVTRGALGPLGPAGAYVAPAALGSAMNRAQQFEDAINSGADIATALEASELGAIIGTTEAVPIGNLLNRLDRVTGGATKKYLVRAVKQGTEEAVQEAFTGIMNDAVAANLYDPERGVWTTDRVEEGAVGFTTGALLETLVTLALPGRRRGQAAGEQAGGEQQAPGGIPQGAVPAEALLGEVQAPAPPGVREQARAATPPPTPEDIESPIPTDLIQEGKSVLQDAQAETTASSILDAAGFPPINSEITLTTRDGGQVTGTVVDAFDQNGQQGAKIRYPDGRVVAETFEALRGRVRAPDAGQAQQEVPGGQAQADAGRVDVGDTGGRGARGRGEPERGGLLDGAPAATGEPGQGPGGLAGEPVAGGPARVPVADAATGGDAALTPGGPATDIRTPPDAGEMQAAPSPPEGAGPVSAAPMLRQAVEAEAAPRQPIPRREAAQAEDTAVTSSGREVPVRYAVVEAADLVASQTDDGRTNPAYPAELQPRDRSRAVSQQQIQDIAGKLNPRLLERSAKASDGAPIISEDGVVESGNGRVLAIRRAYSQGQAQQYRDYLAQQGYPVEGMSQPVLVRVREGQMSPEERQAFTREANERDTLGMSATERAMADAAALPDRLLELYLGGDIDAAVNRDFVRAFVDQVVARNERAGMIAADGSMSQEAVRRIEGALLAKAYGDANLVASLIESADTNIKAIGGAMLDVAPQWAQMRAEAAAGRIDPSMDQTARLLEAVRLVQQARRERRNVAELVGQRDMLSGDALHPTAEAFLALMFRNVRQWTQPVGREKMAEALRFYLDEAARTTPGLDLLGDAAPAPERILQTARERRYGPEDIQQGDLLAQPAGGAVERPREAGEGRAERDEPAAPAQDGVEAARAGEQGAGAEGAVAPPSVRIEDFTEKSIIVRGLGKDDGARFEGLKAKPLWNAKANGWVFSKKREAEVRGALADLLAPVDAPATEQAPEPSPTAQPGPYAKWRDASPAQRREMLREAGYTDNDQARVLSGIDWNQLTDPVRRALSAVQPARQERPQRDGWRQIGTNARGNPLFEDERGVRSYTEGGVRVTESVGVIPGGGISINKDARGNDFRTEEERAARRAPAAPGQEPGESPLQRSMREGRERAAALTRADLERIPNDLTGAIRWWAPDVPQGRELPGVWQTAIGAMEMAWTRGFTGQQIIDARRGLPDPYKAPRDYVLALWDATHRAPTAPAAKTPADRRDEAQRSIYNRRIEDMDPAELRAYAEQLRTALLTDERTGLGSNRAWLNRTPKAYIAAVDLDSLKWVNDNMGHPAGDQLIEAVGEALRATGIEAYHVSGDEFYAQADNAGELRRAMEQAQAALRRVTIEGNGLVFTGPGFSYGIASTLNEAERGLHEHKARREEAGERAARGERPAGVVEAAQVPEQKRTEGDRAQAAEAGEGQGAERPEPDVAPRPGTEAPSSGASQSVTMGPSEEATDGVQGPVSPGDAPAGAADVQPAAPDRGPRRAPAEEGGRGAPAVQRPDRERAEAPERLPEGAVGEGGRGAGAGDADRVPAGRPRAERPAREAARVKGENFTIEPGALAEDRGRVQKARDNIRAIELMRQIEAEGRPATRAEQEQLARYVGWGGLKGAFPDQNGKFEKGLEAVGEKLRELLPETEYATARRSLQYAHYTAENVARTMWAAVQRLGFRGGRVFEPGMGVGNFPGLMPTDLAARTDYHGLELDHTTARIARLLYPRWGVRQDDFTRAPLPKDTYDLVIGNPPFADIPVRSDPAYPQGFLLHDYFFAKSLDAVRPGGLLAFISSAGTMNKIDAAAREYMADRADLVAAIRLPGSAFEQSAGTSVTTDIIILRKRLPDEAAGDRSWTETVEVTLPGKDGRPVKGRVSRYFVDHPEMVLGEEGFFDPLYEGRYAVRAPKGFDLDAALRQALGRLPENVMGEWQDTTDRAEIDFGTAERKEGSFYVGKDGRLMQQREGVGRPVERRGKGVEGGKSLAEIERIKALIPIRDALRAVYAADLADDTANAEKARKRLNESYDAFVKRFGPINKAEFQYRRPTIIQQESARAEAREEARFAGTPWREGDFDATPLVEQGASLAQIARARQEAREKAQKAGQPFDEGSFNPDDMPDVVIERRPNIDPFMDDPESYRLRAIEKYNDETGEAAKGAVFFQNVITRERTPEIKSVHDALLYVLNQKGRLDIAEVARAAGISQSEAIEQLGEGIFRLPGTDNQWVTRDEYLSGNVRRKLRQARAAAARDPSLQRNVDALEAAQPAPLPPSEINANLGMPWIPTEVIEQFGTEALGLGKLRVQYTPALAQWEVTGDTSSAAARSIWGTQDRPAPALIQDALNRQDPRIYREIRVDGRTTRELDTVATEAAQEKVREIKQRFSDWVWSDPGRASTLAELYNEEYNSLVAREYNGDYLTTPGISSNWSWRPHQKRVIARIIQSGNTYMAHSVGAGKTSAMIGAGMEMRRLGLVRKPMYVVPNHMLGQFTKEFYEQYPTARIMVADERRFHTHRRKQFIADVAAEDLDAVIITHSAFGMIPISDEFQDGLIQQQIDQYRELLEDIGKDQESRITRSRLEKQIERLEQRLSGRGQRKRDQVFTFEEMGVDFLFVDEAHLFRKLDFATKMSNVKGISPEGSKASWDLYVKTRYLETVNPGRNLVLASGTPITNTMAELYTVSRYLQPQELRERGLEHFDAWAGAFGDTVTNLEQDAAGGYKPTTRFAKFVNVPELSVMVRQIMDVVTSRQLEQYVTRPKLKGGKRQMHLAEKGEALEAYQADLARRMEAIANRKGPPKPGDDIILSVINDGRHAAIDMRLVDPTLPNDPGSKLNLLVDNVFRIWQETKRQPFHRPEAGGYSAKPVDKGPATQMIFANLGLSGERGFSVPEYIRSELVRRGVPKNEIAYIANYKSHVAKQRLFNDMNEGKVRVLIGSTGTMATGVNAQRRLYALHNLDPLWYPADDEQRNGRILRQGNMNPEVEIHDYSTKGTYDSTMWGMMETKARFIQGFFEGDPSLRDMEDLGEASQYEQAKAITTADPRLIELTELRQQLEKAQRRKAAFEREQYANQQRVAQARDRVRYYQQRIPAIEADIARRQDTSGENFKAVVDGKTYTDRVEVGDLILGRLDTMKGETREYKGHKIGEIGGFDILADVWGREERAAALVIRREGGHETEVRVSGSSRGLVQSLEAVLRGFESDLSDARERLRQAETTIREFEPQIGKEFTGQAEIDRLTEQVRELERALAPKPAAPAGDDGKFALAYHGTPHQFRRFDLSKIGSGEGNLSFGWGIYFADVEEVAEGYRARLARFGPGVQPGTPAYEALLEVERRSGNEQEAYRALIGFARRADASGNAKRADLMRRAAEIVRAGNAAPRGSLMVVDIPDDAVERMLLWDKPLSEQPPVVRAAINDLIDGGFFDPDSVRAIRDFDARGSMIYKMLGMDNQKPGSDQRYPGTKEAAELLRERGVPGLRYFDGTSRAGGEGTMNTVVWDQALLDRISDSMAGGPPAAAETRQRAAAYRLRDDFARDAKKITANLRARLEQLGIAGKVALNLRDRIQAVADGKASEADGRYLNRVIEVALTAPNQTRTLNHEVIHALRDLGLIRDAEWRALSRAAQADTERMGSTRARYGRLGLSDDALIEEAVADMYADWADGRTQTGGFVRRAFERIRDFLQALGRALTGRGYHTMESVFRAIERGDVGRREQPRDELGRFASPDDPRFAAGTRQTETPEFKRWFGDSKVVDENGKPLVVYHGTRNDFSKFRDGPVWFHTDPQQAYGSGEGGNIMPAYVKIERPIRRSGYFGMEDFSNPARFKFFDKAAGQWVTPDGVIGDNGVVVAFSPKQVKSAIGNRGTFDPSNPDIRYALADPAAIDPTAKGGAQARQKAANRWYGTQPLDMAMRLPFHIFGGIDERGQWKWGAALSQKAGNLITNAKFSEEGRFAWLNPALEKARAGLLDRYGLDPQYVERERQRGLDERRIMAKVPEIMQRLAEAKIGTAEAKVLQAVLTGEAVADEDMAKLAEPIRNAIDDMGAEAVQLGLISAEAFERNRGAYLHRVYLKHEADQGGLVRWVSRVATARRRRIIGNQFKGRGMWIEADEGVLMKRVPGFKEAERGRPQEGEKFRVLDLLDDQETLRGIDPKSQRKVMDRVYLPAGAPVPDSLKGYVDRGVWEVRGTKGNKVVLWRDFTKRERESMGEIVDARYTIAKTYMQMAHDLATGRFFRDIALNEDWSSGTEPRGAWKNAEEYSRFWADPEIEWVKVPDTTIPKSQTKRYGALAGRYVRAEIWRDLAELERMQKAGWWDALLRQWKINKTARSPVVHMNNVMSNAVLMDLADVRLVDLYRGIRSMVRNDKDYQEAVDNGTFGSDMVAMEIRRNTLQPLLEEIQRDMQGGKDTMEARIGILGKVADAIWSRAKSLDRKMVSLYQLEDEVFRMATYMRNRDRGMTPAEAALDARDQFLNYDIRAPWVNAARRTVLPFISYTYRAVPVLARAIMLRPWKIAKYMTIAYAVNALAYMVAGGDEEEERRALRDTEQGRTWFGTPRMVRMPWSDEYGNPVFLDVRRWIPAGDVFDMNQGHGAIAVPAPLQFGGPLMLAGELALNKQAFTGDEIVNDRTDDWWDKSSKIADWAWKSWMPSAAWIPGSWYWEKIGDAATGARDRQGRPYSLATAAASSVGIKLKPHDVQEEFFWKGVEFERIERELKAELKSLARDHDRGRISDAAFERRERRIMEKMDRLGQERERTFNPR